MKKILFLVCFMPLIALAADVEWSPAKAGTNVSMLRVPGKVIPKEGALSIESARIQGRVTNILRREGEEVNAGDALFLVNGPECVSLAEEKRVAAERGLKELIDASNNRESQLGLSVSNSDCRILATHDGTIVRRQVELGANFNIGDSLMTILDVKNLTVELEIPERDMESVKPNQIVRLQFPSYPGRRFVTEIDRILPSIDPQTRTIKVRVKPANLPSSITLDALVLAEIDVHTNEQILKVPTTALVFDDNTQYVIKKTTPTLTAVPVEVISESENESSIRPWTRGTLDIHDAIATKGAIYLFNALKSGTALPQ